MTGRKLEPPAGSPRIAPIPTKEWPSEMRQALAVLEPPVPRHPLPDRRSDRPKALNALGTLAHYPALAQAFHTFNGHILFATTLSERQRELVVLRVAALRNAAYEWAQHAVLAGDVGIQPDEIDRILDGPTTEGWSALDGALLRAVDELVADAMITDATWAELAAELTHHQLMDLIFTVGAYDVLAMAFRSFKIALDDDLLRK